MSKLRARAIAPWLPSRFGSWANSASRACSWRSPAVQRRACAPKAVFDILFEYRLPIELTEAIAQLSEVGAAADWVTLGNAEDGVSVALQKYWLLQRLFPTPNLEDAQ